MVVSIVTCVAWCTSSKELFWGFISPTGGGCFFFKAAPDGKITKLYLQAFKLYNIKERHGITFVTACTKNLWVLRSKFAVWHCDVLTIDKSTTDTIQTSNSNTRPFYLKTLNAAWAKNCLLAKLSFWAALCSQNNRECDVWKNVVRPFI